MHFVKFPSTPHLAVLGSAVPRSDKLLSDREVRHLLAGNVVVEEKVDGANVGISLDQQGQLRTQNRGHVLVRGEAHPQFKPLFHWMQEREEALKSALSDTRVLFGEWCYAVHTVRYARLPDWFLAFDVYDRTAARFWSARRRDELAKANGFAVVPRIARGRFSVKDLQGMLGSSALTDGPAEGIYIRQDDDDWLIRRAKLVRPEFVQATSDHWTSRRLERNRVMRINTQSRGVAIE